MSVLSMKRNSILSTRLSLQVHGNVFRIAFPRLDGPSRTLSSPGPKEPAIAGSISVIENHTNSSAQLPVAAKVFPKVTNDVLCLAEPTSDPLVSHDWCNGRVAFDNAETQNEC